MKTRNSLLLGLCLTVVCPLASPAESSYEIVTTWSQSDNKHVRNFASRLLNTKWVDPKIHVCWENPTEQDEAERLWVRDAIDASWGMSDAVDFMGWGVCEPSDDRSVRIRIADKGARVTALGKYLAGKPDGVFLNLSLQNWSPRCASTIKTCIEAVAVHEFGHVLGFTHEQNRIDAPRECRLERQGTNGDWEVTAYDPDSIMNYCNTNWTVEAKLSAKDLEALMIVYG